MRNVFFLFSSAAWTKQGHGAQRKKDIERREGQKRLYLLPGSGDVYLVGGERGREKNR